MLVTNTSCVRTDDPVARLRSRNDPRAATLNEAHHCSTRLRKSRQLGHVEEDLPSLEWASTSTAHIGIALVGENELHGLAEVRREVTNEHSCVGSCDGVILRKLEQRGREQEPLRDAARDPAVEGGEKSQRRIQRRDESPPKEESPVGMNEGRRWIIRTKSVSLKGYRQESHRRTVFEKGEEGRGKSDALEREKS